MGILVGTWKEGTIKVAVPSHWWRAKHFQGLFHSKRPNAPPQCTLFAQFCSGIKHQETSHSKLLIPILGSCCCWMIFKIALPFLFSLGCCCRCCCCWGLSACRFYPPLEVVHWPPIHPFESTWHHFRSGKVFYLASVLEIRARAITMCIKTPLLDLACGCFCHVRPCNTDMCACASPSLWFYTHALVLSCTGLLLDCISNMCTIEVLHSGCNHFSLTSTQLLLLIYLPTCVDGPFSAFEHRGLW